MLTGCGTYSRYHRPDLSMENLYSTLPADADTTTLASLSWREMFTDPKLQSLIETGLDRNTDLNVPTIIPPITPLASERLPLAPTP